MSIFSQWCRSAHRTFLISHPRLRLGQVNEVVAAALGHKTYASFKSQDEPRLDQAAYALMSIEEMVRRASDLDAELSEQVCREAVRQLRLGRNGDGRYVVADGLESVTRIILLDTDHPARHEFAHELNGELDNTTASYAEPVVPLAEASGEWRWLVRGSVNILDIENGWAVPVVAEVVFPRLGRHLFAKGFIESLQRDGGLDKYEPEYIWEHSYIKGFDD